MTGTGQASEATPEDAAMHAGPAALTESMVLALLIRASGSRYSGGLFQLPVPDALRIGAAIDGVD